MNLHSALIGFEDPKRLTDYYTKLFGKPAMEDRGWYRSESRADRPSGTAPGAADWRTATLAAVVV